MLNNTTTAAVAADLTNSAVQAEIVLGIFNPAEDARRANRAGNAAKRDGRKAEAAEAFAAAQSFRAAAEAAEAPLVAAAEAAEAVGDKADRAEAHHLARQARFAGRIARQAGSHQLADRAHGAATRAFEIYRRPLSEKAEEERRIAVSPLGRGDARRIAARGGLDLLDREEASLAKGRKSQGRGFGRRAA
ncbi:MAG: hypothetical protein ABIJ46_03285 [bacterium]